MITETSLQKLKDSFIIDEIKSPFRKYIAYSIEEHIEGYISYDVIYDRIEIINVFVQEEKRNQKIGTNLLNYLIKNAKNNQIKNITLEVKKTNIIAIKLYESMHFKNVATKKNYYGDIDGILMELML